MLLSKTDFLIARDCNKNAWLKIHRPDKYKKQELSAFDLNIIETGNEIDALARQLFPGGVLVEDRKDATCTNELIAKRTPVIYQPVFTTPNYLAVADIIVWNSARDAYDLYEVKSSTASEEEGGRKTADYLIDLAFQKVVIDSLLVPLGACNLIRLNKEYVRSGELSIPDLFLIEDLTDGVETIVTDIEGQMAGIHEYVNRENEPTGHCDCIYKSKGNHCSTFWYSCPDVPTYSVHHISRIHKTKLTAFVEDGTLDILSLSDTQVETLSDIQQRQVTTAQSGRITVDQEGVETFLSQLSYPLAFIDYETYPCAIPKYFGYRPYQQVPFQFSLHVISEPGAEMTHVDFIHTDATNPDEPFLTALEANLPASGTILVWNKKFEKGINDQLAARVPRFQNFVTGIQERIIDLMDPFSGNTAVYDHPAFKGSASIKYVLPALVPELSYKNLEVQEGGTAADTWNRIVSEEYDEDERVRKINALREYCTLDTLAMVKIWEVLSNHVK